MLPVPLIHFSLQDWRCEDRETHFWVICANGLAVLEHINYCYVQLMIDNNYDIAYLLSNKRLKKANLAKDLLEERI
jgi:hypothetical protein